MKRFGFGELDREAVSSRRPSSGSSKCHFREFYKITVVEKYVCTPTRLQSDLSTSLQGVGHSSLIICWQKSQILFIPTLISDALLNACVLLSSGAATGLIRDWHSFNVHDELCALWNPADRLKKSEFVCRGEVSRIQDWVGWLVTGFFLGDF